jgi:glycerol uptake facilitator-like aquaporin
MLNTYLSEALGSFVFFLVIMATGDKFMIPVALFIGIILALFGGAQAHLNPAVTFMMLLDGKVNNNEAMWYIGSQLVAAFAAVQWVNAIKKGN